MKKVLICCFICFICLFFVSGCSFKDDNKLVLVTEAGFAPYEFYQDGEIVGVDIEIAREIAKELGKELVVKDVSFDFLINEVKSGKADFAAAGISITDERKKQVDFTDEYTVSNQVVVVKKDSPITSFDEIRNKRIAVQLGTVADLYVSDNYPDATLVQHKKYLSAVEDVKAEKVDCLIMDELPAKEIVKANSELKIMDGVLFQDRYGMIVKKGNDVTLVTNGETLSETLDCAKILEENNIKAEVIHLPVVKPLDEATILASAKKTNKVVTIENHSIIGGVGSAICELLSEKYPVKTLRIGTNDVFGQSGEQRALMEYYGLTAEKLAEKIRGIL